LRVEGLFNLLLLAGIMGGVLVEGAFEGELGNLVGGIIMLSMGLLSLLLTPRRLRQANGFQWGPIVEVAVLFAGIFVAMVPALELLPWCRHWSCSSCTAGNSA
jgi:hypothetical protein